MASIHICFKYSATAGLPGRKHPQIGKPDEMGERKCGLPLACRHCLVLGLVSSSLAIPQSEFRNPHFPSCRPELRTGNSRLPIGAYERVHQVPDPLT